MVEQPCLFSLCCSVSSQSCAVIFFFFFSFSPLVLGEVTRSEQPDATVECAGPALVSTRKQPQGTQQRAQLDTVILILLTQCARICLGGGVKWNTPSILPAHQVRWSSVRANLRCVFKGIGNSIELSPSVVPSAPVLSGTVLRHQCGQLPQDCSCSVYIKAELMGQTTIISIFFFLLR